MATFLGQRQKGLNKPVATQKLRQEEEQAPATRGTAGLWAVLALHRAGFCSTASSAGTPAQPRCRGRHPHAVLLVGGRGQEADWDSETLPRCLTFSTNPKTGAKSTILMWRYFTSNNWTAFLAEVLYSTASSKSTFWFTNFLQFKGAKKTTLLYHHADS